MIGAIAGDVLGSVYESHTVKTKNFRLFHELDRPTDDTVLSLAVAQAILSAGGKPRAGDYQRELRDFGRRYPKSGYGGAFRAWMLDSRRGPYNSWGNGSAMRASAVGWAFESEAEVLRQAEMSALPTHNHPEGVKGAQAVALAVFLARDGKSKEVIRAALSDRFGYDMGRKVESIRPEYRFEVSCPASVPEAIISFLDSTDFEDAVRNAVSLGGDSDTLACIAGAAAEAFYGGVPSRVLAWVLPRLEEGLLDTLDRFARKYLPEPQARAVRDERAARALACGGGTGSEKARPSKGKPPEGLSPRARLPNYTFLLHGEVRNRLADYAARLGKNPGIAGARLKKSLERRTDSPPDAAWLLAALLNTKRPRIFAESEVAGDGTDWTQEELRILGDIGVAVPVTVFDDGRKADPRPHEKPFGATLLFTPGVLLAARRGPSADSGIAPGGTIEPARYRALCERRLLPLLRYAGTAASASGRKAFITVPGLGCGQIAGKYRGSMGPRLRDALTAVLTKYADTLPGIRAVWLDPCNECSNERREIGRISFRVRPLALNEARGTGLGHAQLCPPAAYEEPGDDFSGCRLYSIVEWDHVSWPGNDFWGGVRDTDGGVKAAATDALFALTGFRGRYDAVRGAYLPPEGVDAWEDLVREHRLTLRAADNVMIAGSAEGV